MLCGKTLFLICDNPTGFNYHTYFKLLAASVKPEKIIFMWLLRIIMIDAIFCVIPFTVTYLHLLLLTRKNERGNVCFCFATKLFWWWLTSSFEHKKPVKLTNVLINTFFTMCTKQEKEEEGGQKKPVVLKLELKATQARWVHKSCQDSCHSYSQFLTAHLLSRKKNHSFF